MKLKKLINENTITEKLVMDDSELTRLSRDIVLKYFSSRHNPDLISSTKDGKEQNLLLKDLQSAIKGAIKSVISNYKGTYYTQNSRDVWKK